MQKKAVLKKRLLKSGVDGILITDLNNVRYISGFTGSSGFLVITGNASVFVTDFRYKEQARIEIKGFRIKITRTERPETIKALVESLRIKKLGFEGDNLSYRMYRRLLNKKMHLRALTDTVEDMRIIKSAEELSMINTAVRRAEDAFRKLRPYIRAGITEQKLAVRFEELLKRQGCKNLPFGVIVASGPRSALPHAKPTNRIIKKGDIVLFDWGGECGGYYSDMTRVVVIRGRQLEKQRNIYSILLEARNRAIKTVRAGVKSSDIDSAARDYIRDNGYGKYFGHGTGHGIGLEVHERPVISWQDRKSVASGMVFTVEPGIYLPGFGGFRIEDMVSVQKNGPEILTSLPRTLKVIDN
jgi:Xaa-Pro aminopeptidase